MLVHYSIVIFFNYSSDNVLKPTKMFHFILCANVLLVFHE